MGSLVEAVSLAGYRAVLQRYCDGIELGFDSVAGQIIAQRKPARYSGHSLRPPLVLWACDANRGDLTDALPVAAAFDLFDRFMLLHDELVNADAESVARWGLGQSLNAGDALYAVGFRCLANDVGDPHRRLLAAQIVAEAVLAAVGARCSDRKGEAELTRAALHAGAVVAGASPERSEAFARAGHALGEALECADAADAQRSAMESAEVVRRYVDDAKYDDYLEAARYIARRNH